ncbi:aryl hydrocarbon receptor [Monodelphis domestica]|uniref:aryl hydrocarbon receptor n=1 Tax=Monodelphis domestica TaxID=13616 RepID=UPI0024E21425|nr:aryl hydrocarbon receptor [Monodelphis domestica]
MQIQQHCVNRVCLKRWKRLGASPKPLRTSSEADVGLEPSSEEAKSRAISTSLSGPWPACASALAGFLLEGEIGLGLLFRDLNSQKPPPARRGLCRAAVGCLEFWGCGGGLGALPGAPLPAARPERRLARAARRAPSPLGIPRPCRDGPGLRVLSPQALNGFVLVVTTDALVFYASSTIQDYLGFQQSDVIHQSVFELIHTEDRAEFQRQLQWTPLAGQAADPAAQGQEGPGLAQTAGYYSPEQLPAESLPFLERSFICRLRCLLDNSSGFLAMNFQGRLKFLHGQNKKGKDGACLAPQLALFAVATPLQPPSILEIRTKNFIFRTKHKLDFTPTGCDAKGRLVLGYTEAELCMRGSGYQFLHAADMLYCADSHIRMIKTGESGMTVFRLLTKENRWTWVQSNARLVYKNGRPDYIIATQRPLTDEEGAEHLRKRSGKLPFMFTTGEAVLYEVTFLLPGPLDAAPVRPKQGSGPGGEGAAGHPWGQGSFHPTSILGSVLRQDEAVYLCPPAPRAAPLDRSFGSEMAEDLRGLMSGDWPGGSADLLKREQGLFSHEAGLDPPGALADGGPGDLYGIMRSLGLDFEDLRHLQREEFFRTDLLGGDDMGDIDPDLTDEILTYVQTSLNKAAFSHSGPQQQAQNPLQPPLQPQYPLQQAQPQQPIQQAQNPLQPPLQSQHSLPPRPGVPPQPPNSSCMVQEQLHQQRWRQQQQLCQKMKHLQVGAWKPGDPEPFPCPQLEPQPYEVLAGLTDAELPYKADFGPGPYAQSFLPCSQPLFPPTARLDHLDFPMEALDQSQYPASHLGDFVSCFQETPGPGGPSQPPQGAPPGCYAGAVSMFQCQPEGQASSMGLVPYHPLGSSQHPALNKFQNGFNGGVLSESFAAPFNSLSSSSATSCVHPAEARPFPDIASGGFL